MPDREKTKVIARCCLFVLVLGSFVGGNLVSLWIARDDVLQIRLAKAGYIFVCNCAELFAWPPWLAAIFGLLAAVTADSI